MEAGLYRLWYWAPKANDWYMYKTKRPWQRRYRTLFNWGTARELGNKIARTRPAGHVVMRGKGAPKPDWAPPGEKIISEDERKWALVRKWLDGDLDANLDLMYRIAQVARDINEPLWVAEGSRSLADQWKYWLAYIAGKGPLAAYPGTSNHTDRGDGAKAADVRKDKVSWQDIGEIPGARGAMAKYGLCLPVPGEPWHVEIGNTWKA